MPSVRAPVIILAGGKSTRLGRDKASEVIAGKSLLQHVVDACGPVASRLVAVGARGQSLPRVRSEAPYEAFEDLYPETGPLGGIYTGLQALASPAQDSPDYALVVACDMPLLQSALLHELLRLAPGHDTCVPVTNGHSEPLCAVYALTCRDTARRLLERGQYRATGLVEAVDALLVPEEQWRPFDPDGLSFLNVNREQDLERVRGIIEARR